MGLWLLIVVGFEFNIAVFVWGWVDLWELRPTVFETADDNFFYSKR